MSSFITCRHVFFERNLGTDDAFVSLEWYVTADQVIEQDAQRPHGGRHAEVLLLRDPLRWTVHSSTYRFTHSAQMFNFLHIVC